jgi:hypothetical protein
MMDDRYASDGYYGEAGTRNPEEPASAAYLPAGHFDTPEGSVYIPSEAELDDPAPLELEDQAELAVINGEYPDVEAFYASRCNHKPTPELSSVQADVYALILYNWQSEETDYYNELRMAGDDADAKELIEKSHIFAVMKRLGEWVNF